MITIDFKEGCHFTIHNIPFGVFSLRIGDGRKLIGTALGDYAVQLDGLVELMEREELLNNSALINALKQETLNDFMALGRPVCRQLRGALIEFFQSKRFTFDDPQIERFFHPLSSVQMHLPVSIGDYTDFYASREHASNVGEMFRGKENALMPNWLHLPVGYHGRASSIVVSGTPIKRPRGQCKPPTADAPLFKASEKLDFELEMAFVVGVGNNLGEPIPIERANEHIFGVCLLNDWSSRDIQAWEYVPLGPFLGKNFGSTISPWIVTLDALEPFLTAGPEQQPQPLPYLQEKPQNSSYDISLQVSINDSTVCTSNLKYLYWSFAQQLAHHTVNGCNMRTGDICGTGTISGPTPDSFGSLLELSWNGTKQVNLTASDQQRTYLQDGDTVRMTGFCQKGEISLGFGECSGRIIGSD